MPAVDAGPEDPFCTVREVCARLRVSKSWLYEQLQEGYINGVQFGRAWRVRESVIRELEQRGMPAAPTPGRQS